MINPIQLLAFYLPQYHPIPENDEWWGKGFTEWTNVTRATPQFKGHHQPDLPADLGFYDLRLPEARQAQVDLARGYGISGFCYYHYWFGGRRLLERPINDVLKTGTPDFPFLLCWANENWTRTWGGGDHEILMGQAYGDDDDRAHIRSLLPAFADRRYVRVDGKPLFMVYRVSRLPNPARTAEIWREEALKAGVGEIFLGKVESYGGENYGDPAAIGFDAGIEFAPDSVHSGPQQSWTGFLKQRNVHEMSWSLFRALDVLGTAAARQLHALGLVDRAYVEHLVFDYLALKRNMLAKARPPYRWMPCVTPAWDNSARRRSGAKIYKNASPTEYQAWLAEVIRRELTAERSDRIVFVNAWNEWAEGNHLEPCARWGRAYLEATQAALAANHQHVG